MNFLFCNRWIWGFSEGAESWNGRLAMLAFTIIIVIEFISATSIINILGFLEL